MRILGIALAGLILCGTARAEEQKLPLPKPTEVFTQADLRIERYESACNTFLVFCVKTDEFVCIDPSPGIAAVVAAQVKAGKKFKAVWITHEHGDHVAGLAEVLATHKVPSISCEDGRKGIAAVREQWGGWGFAGQAAPPDPDILLKHGDVVKVGEFEFKAFRLPGHAPGSIGYLLGDRVLFAGDVLFRGSVGRTDLPTSDLKVFQKSLSDHLWDLAATVNVFPGHGDRTTIGREKKANWLFQDYVRVARGEKPIPRPWFGINLDRERKVKGLKLIAISPDSPAEKCGLEVGDVLIKMGEKEIADVDDFMSVFLASKVGDKVPLTVVRGEQGLEVTIEFTARPAN